MGFDIGTEMKMQADQAALAHYPQLRAQLALEKAKVEKMRKALNDIAYDGHLPCDNLTPMESVREVARAALEESK